MIRIFIVDDHDLMRAGLRHILAGNSEWKVVGEANCGEQAIELLESEGADLVLMDLNMPGMGGIEATRRLIAAHPGIRVIALTALSETPFPRSLHEAGALGYISKGCTPDELFEGIRIVSQGRPFVSSEVAQKISIEVLNGQQGTLFAQLSGREMDVLMLILAGRKSHQISALLALSPKTVSTYRNRILSKLGVDSDVTLTLLCLRHGLLPDERCGDESIAAV